MDKKALLKALRDTAQATSNEIANTVAMPIDLINSGLGRIGLGSETPVGGSKWFADMGLTSPVEEGSAPQLAGETLGLVLPMAGAMKAKEIAAALRKGGENLAKSVPIARGGERGVLAIGGTPAEKVATEGQQVTPALIASLREGGKIDDGLRATPKLDDFENFPTSIDTSQVRALAEEFADRLKKMGLTVTLDHSGSRAGLSSYMTVWDDAIGRGFTKPIRISDHSKGPFKLAENINVLNPKEDFQKITSRLNEIRAMGDSPHIKQMKYAQKLIEEGVKPKTAYRRAREEVPWTE